MKMKQALAFGAILLVAACGVLAPKMRGTVLLERGLQIVSEDSTPFTISRLIVNDSPENPACNEYPNRELKPGQSLETTFILCGKVNKVAVQTERGTRTLSFGN